jgi:hypothetical protein
MTVGVEWEEREGMIESENLIISNDIKVKMSETLNRRRLLQLKCARKHKFIWRDSANIQQDTLVHAGNVFMLN